MKQTKTTPCFSVVIATYRRAHLLSRAIDSVLNQTFTDFELLVVDDASPDDTELVVRAYGDGRVRYVRCARIRGGAGARNVGVRQARGEFIAFLDDDDEIYLVSWRRCIRRCTQNRKVWV